MPAVVPLVPIRLHDARLTIAADDYTAAVGEVRVVPDATWETDRLFGGRSVPSLVGVAWTVDLVIAQDLSTGSLLRYLLEHPGQVKACRFEPSAGGAGVDATVVLIPAPLGGAPGEVLTGAVSLPMVGPPQVT